MQGAFFPFFIILIMLSLWITVQLPLMRGFQVCLKAFILTFWLISFGAVVSMITSVIFVQASLFTEGLRYVFSHIILMALFLALMSNRLRPPFWVCRVVSHKLAGWTFIQLIVQLVIQDKRGVSIEVYWQLASFVSGLGLVGRGK